LITFPACSREDALRMTKFAVLVAALLLAGCLEAVDLAEERVVSPATCVVPNGVALCGPELPVQARPPAS
jgi:hypothetical protein